MKDDDNIPSYILYGIRSETYEECESRLEKEALIRGQELDYQRRQFEQLKYKLGIE